jgi:gliding motility-associated-like protein
LTATVTGTNTLKWYTVATGGTGVTSAPTPLTTAAGTTSYWVSQTNGTCEGPRTKIDIVITSILAPTASNVDYCLNQTPSTLTATATGTNTLKWYTVATGGTGATPAPTPITTAEGTTSYWVTQTNGICESPRTKIDVIVSSLTAPNATNVDYCLNQTPSALTASATGTNTLKWYTVATGGTGVTTAQTPLTTATGTTSYWVTQTNGTCESPRTKIDVIVIQTPEIVFGTTPSGCEPMKVDLTDPSLTVGSTSGSTFQYWLNAAGTIPLTNPSSVGNGTYYISNTKNGCKSTPIAVPVLINPIPIANFTPSPYLVSTISQECKIINQSFGAVKYFWDFGDGAVSDEVSPTHIYSSADTASYIIKLIANSTLGCSDTISKKVKVYEELIYFIPNTFTPDQDNFNNTFQPVFVSGFDPYSYTMTIFNRWGEMVFESHDSKIGWKGTYGKDNAEIVKEGVYTWKIEFSLKSDDRRKQITGLVNLIK